MSERLMQEAVAKFIAYAKRPGVVAFHIPNEGKRGWVAQRDFRCGGGMAGLPDWMLIADGRAYGLELKTAKGRLTPSQAMAHDRLKEAGMKVEIARSVDEAVAVLRGWNLVREDVRLVNRARLDAEVLT